MTAKAKLVNAEAIELIECVLEKHTDAVLEAAREKVEQMRHQINQLKETNAESGKYCNKLHADIDRKNRVLKTVGEALDDYFKQYPVMLKGYVLDAQNAITKELSNEQ